MFMDTLTGNIEKPVGSATNALHFYGLKKKREAVVRWIAGWNLTALVTFQPEVIKMGGDVIAGTTISKVMPNIFLLYSQFYYTADL